jgi:ABC-type antimicrobial peptide transport system permease subunit
VLGRILELHEDIDSSRSDAPPDVVTVTGLVGDEKFWRLDAEPTPQIYAIGAGAGRTVALLARVAGPGIDPVASIRTAVARIDGTLPVYATSTLVASARDSSQGRRFTVAVMSLFGVVALLLAAAGVYAQTAWSVEDRRVELGVRVALGASSRSILGTVFRGGSAAIGGGVVAGLALALGFAQVLASSLYGVSVVEPKVLILATAVLGVAACTALLVPGIRATRIDPVTVLKEE